jgi:hypothetical protein
MLQPFFPLLGLIVLAVTIYWVYSVLSLFRTLKERHPGMYEQIGSPTLSNPNATGSLVSFLLTRKPEQLGDAGLIKQANVLRAILAIYAPLFVAFIAYLILYKA